MWSGDLVKDRTSFVEIEYSYSWSDIENKKLQKTQDWILTIIYYFGENLNHESLGTNK